MKRILLLASSAMLLGGTFSVGAQTNCFTVICPQPKIVSCDDTNWTFDQPVVVDNCCHNYAVIPLGPVPTGTCPLSLMQTWDIVDGCGHSNQCRQTVTVVNTNQPVFQGANNITVYSCTNIQVFYNVTASETCCGSLGVRCSPPSGTPFTPGVTFVTCTTSDCCSNTYTTTFFVDVINTNQPVFQGVGNITVTSCTATPVFYNPTATEACCGALDVVCSPPSGSLFQLGPTPVTCTVMDCHSNVFTTTFYVAVNGGPGVQLVCTNKSVVCGTDWNYDPPTIYDPCCPDTNYVIGYEGPFTNGIGPCAQTNSIIWIVSDQCGNSTNCEQFVTILNTLLVYPTNQFISCNSPVPTNPPSYFSGCCSNVTFSLLETFTNSSGCDQLLSQVWQATDCCSNLITVTNTVTVLPASPTILCASNKVIGSTGCKLPNGAAGFAVLYSFPQTNTDGMNPRAGLLLGSDFVLYGTTYNGGAYGTGGGGFGTVFKIKQDGTGYQVIHDFDGFGENPVAGLIEGANGALYGTTVYGGNAFGTLFKLNKDGTGFQVLHNFDSGNPAIDGDYPEAGLVLAANGTLYGTTSSGGQYGYGTVFSLDAGGNYSVLYSFGNSSSDGRNPWGALVVGPDGALYGTTRNGGADTFGSVFRLDLDGNNYLPLYSFGLVPGDGASPVAGLVVGAGGILYGTTYGGGTYGVGAVYAFQTNGIYTTLYSFGGFPGDGNTPYAGLLVGCDQALYGTTYAGGDSGFGTAFTLNQDGTGYAVLKSFTASDGVNPYGGLAQGTDGLLYGATSGDGPNGAGTVFQLPLTLAGLFDPPTLVGGCCGTNVSIQVVSTVGVNTPCGQSVTRTWLITDCCGNTNVCNQTVTVGSTNGPVLNCPSIAVTCGTPIPTNPPTAYSLGCSNVIVTLLSEVTNSLGCTQFISRAWQAVDCCSNTAVCTQLVTVAASVPPTCSTLFSHSGSNNPAGEGWNIEGGDANTSGTGINDGGTPSWHVVDGSTHALLAYEGTLTTAQTGQGNSYGWVLSTTLRLPNSGQPTDDIDVAYYDGLIEWEMAFGTTPAGDPYVVLANTGPGEIAYGPTYTNLGAGTTYNTYVLKYDPTTQTANLYVNGILRIPNFPAPTLNYTASTAVRWGGISTPNTGVGNFAAVDFCLGNPPGPSIRCASDKTVPCGTPWTFDPPTPGGCCDNLVYSLVSSNLVSSTGCQNIYRGLWQVSDCCSNTFLCAQLVTVVIPPPTVLCYSNKTVQCGNCWTYSILETFYSTNGAEPVAAVLQGQNGALYGTTAYGALGAGTVFTINPDGSGYQVLHVFGNVTNDGQGPVGLYQDSQGVLYATAFGGGNIGRGAIVKISPDGLTWSVLHSFGSNPNDGANPPAALILGSDGAFYGTTYSQGAHGGGTIFRLQPDGTFQTLHQFGDIAGDGAGPMDALIQGQDGALYGTTANGGAHGGGTVFSIHTDGTDYQVLRPLGQSSTDASTPFGGLVQSGDGTLFGTSVYGGTAGEGTVFMLDTHGNNYGILHNFSNSPTDAIQPEDGLSFGRDGALYGTAFGGGAGNAGAVFKLNTDGSGFTLIHSFGSTPGDGANPLAGLALGNDGALYGGTAYGGSNNRGILFRLAPGTSWSFDPPTVIDACCSNIVPVVLGTVTNGQCPQQITRTWLISDCCSNATICTQMVSVVTAPPVLTCTPLTVPAGSPIPTNPPSVIANCCTNVTVFLAGSVTNSVGCTNFIYQDWQAIDCCGQTTNCTRVVTVTCPTNCLTIECPSNILVVTCSNGVNVNFPAPLATDTCCSNVFFSFNPPSGTFFAAGTSNYPVQVTATDSCGSNTATCGFSVTVLAATEPVVSLLATQVTVTACSSGCGLGPDVANLVVITGGNSGPYFISQNPPGGPAPGTYLICGDTNITITVSNSCGWFTNLYVGVRMQIVCTNPATCLNFCPPDIVVTNCGSGPVPVFFETICGLAACCGNSKVFYCFSPPSGSLFPADGVPRPVTATLSDYCRDTNICVFTVTVIPNTNLPAIIAPTNITLCTGATLAGPLVVDGGSQDLTTPGFCSEGDGAIYATNIAWYVTRRSADPSRTNVLIYSTQYLPSKASEGGSLALALEAAGFNVTQDPPPWPCSASCIAPGFSNSLAFYLNNPSNHFDAVFLGGIELYGDQNFEPGAGIIDYFLAGARPYPLNQPDGIPALMNFLTNGGGVFLAAEGGAACSSGVNDNSYAQWSQVLHPLGLDVSYPWNVSIGGDYCSWTWIYLCSTNPTFGGADLTVPDGTLTVLPSPVVNGVTNLFYSGANEVFVTGASPVARLVAFAGSHGLIGVSGCIIPTTSNCGVMPDVASLLQFQGGGPVTVNQSISPGATVCANTTVLVTISNACGHSTNLTLPVILGPSCANCLTLECPSNVVVTTCSNSAPVFYTPYVNDLCTSNWTLTVVPPSGSLFPFGTTRVSASVFDSLGNSNSCSFAVTVLSPHLTISRSEGTISLTWAGGGTLETANTITGPWTPIPGAVSPYTTPAVEAARFYRFVCH